MKSILTQNSKMKKSGKKIWNWGIPAYRSNKGFATCPWAGQCAKGCYATMGAYVWSNVAHAFEARLELAKSDNFVSTVDAEVKRLFRAGKLDTVRIHDSGDFFNVDYLDKWLTIMRLNPKVKFYAYTKAVKLFKDNQYRFPKNFIHIFSFGGKQDHMIDLKKDKHSMVFETLDELKKHKYLDATDDDALVLGRHKKIGLVYHGNKGYNNSEWSEVMETWKDIKKAG